ncbi:DUF5750 family protein [uncultured Methanobrevibacter sp.]|uniref:DUF5750 family protein n=1 Tax=uncultured Methanobrevibacter sp. TaxID=253161 RepID=UPI0025E93960|nr:DUF5750 family protein [uncultured Methanobrevibacter sp.]
MIVEIVDYGVESGKYFIEYSVSGLSLNQMEFLNSELSEKTEICGDIFKIKMYFNEKLYPFQSDVAKMRIDDFIAREEIEMNIFLSSFLEDM